MSVLRVAIYTAFVFIATIILQIYTPATRGYFNLGEAAIYSIAYIASPLVAGIAGGVGSALADLATGYGIFAPGTLVIKFSEGYLASYLMKRLSRTGIVRLRILSIVVAFLVGLLISLVGSILWSGGVEVTSVPIDLFGYQLIALSLSITISSLVWILIGVIIFATLIYLILIRGSENISSALAMSIGGVVMVTGYLLYEYFVSNPIQGLDPRAAFLEVPVNFGQVIFGISISLPVTGFLRRASE